MNIFSFSSSDPAVKSLLAYTVGNEEEKWTIRAVETLVKKLRKKNGVNGTVEDLKHALENPVQASKCVTIPRSIDGRLQVSHRKGLPHVIYCQLWRWPNVQSHHELRAIPTCHFPYDKGSEQICINPYHYTRVEQHMGPMILSAPSSYYNRGSPLGGGVSPSSSGSESEYSMNPMSYNMAIPPGSMLNQGGLGSLGYRGSPEGVGSSYMYHRLTGSISPSALSDDAEDVTRKLSCSSVQTIPPELRITDTVDSNVWCTISYYELNSRIGEPFKVSGSEVTVDGFTDPNTGSNRICLGLLSNVNRNHLTEKTRCHIGRGVKFVCDENAVTVTNLSQTNFFVQSSNANIRDKRLRATVCRVVSDEKMVVFDFNYFNKMLEIAKDYESAYELHKMCFIRMSFVKGWGQHYNRQEVTSTPCWIEMQLHRPLTEVDRVITRVSPSDAIKTNSR
uniref:Mothers against decapentaplegic homolog n=1 Tax=Panagrellus redivivus TaxID=6233 RepID=A0A7E4V1D6_PANRE